MAQENLEEFIKRMNEHIKIMQKQQESIDEIKEMLQLVVKGKTNMMMKKKGSPGIFFQGLLHLKKG